MAAQKCVPGAETASDSLLVIVDKGLGYPARGVYVGNDPRVVIPADWDGKGATPLGWTKTTAPVWTKDALTSWVPLPDALATTLQSAPVQARLVAAERTTLAAAIAARVSVDLETQGATPKPVAVLANVAIEGTK